MITLDEAIAYERQQAKDKRNEHYTFGIQKSKEDAEEHEQIVEWLEELKELKKSAQNRRFYMMGYNAGYKKAINDFAEKLKQENKETIPTHSGFCRMSFDEVVDEIAEQLKKG